MDSETIKIATTAIAIVFFLLSMVTVCEALGIKGYSSRFETV
jgi:hypothetical protein